MTKNHRTKEQITVESIRNELRAVIDPEINIDIVSLGLIYDISIATVQNPTSGSKKVHILMTLTTPGCPLASTIEDMIHRSLDGVFGLDGYLDVSIEITFDPPWTIEMMDPESRAKLGFD